MLKTSNNLPSFQDTRFHTALATASPAALLLPGRSGHGAGFHHLQLPHGLSLASVISAEWELVWTTG